VVEFMPEKEKFGMNEKPKFRFTSKKVFSEQGRIIEEFAEPEVLDVLVYGPDHEIFDIEANILKMGGGEYEIELSKGRAFRPGLYRIRMEVKEGEETYETEDEFLWGVLAINTHKSIYLENKSKVIRDESDQWSLDSIKRRLRTIFERRERKILNSAHGFIDSGVAPENLTPEEKGFFEKVVECVKSFENEREEGFESGQESLVLVTILEDVKKFVGINMKNYGPFKRGDVTTLPEPNADLLVKKNLAEKTEMK
jgi:hypothetical protein